MVDRVECSGVFIDDRVRSERWVRRNSIDTSTISSAGSFVTPEEPEALQADVELLLEVCRQGRVYSMRCVRDHVLTLWA